MVIKRGQLYWIDFGPPRGSGPGFHRPGLVVQSNHFNRSKLDTIIVALLTTNLRLAQMEGNVLLKSGKNGLRDDSVVNVTQMVAVDRRNLQELIGTVTASDMSKVDEGLRLVLALD